MFIHILITLGFYFILIYLSVNILGFFVRGLFSDPELNRLKKEDQEFIKQEIKRYQQVNGWTNIIAFILIIAYFYALFYFWNIGVLITAVIIMIGRLPDLLWEIKHRRKINPELIQKNVIYYLSFFLILVALPILYFSLY